MASSSSSRSYPVFTHTLEDVSANRDLFFETLAKLHQHMGTTFKIHTFGGQDLDFYKLFVEVTSRGGIDKVRSEQRLTEVVGSLGFPSPKKDTPSKLGEYYDKYLYHYEQIFLFNARGSKPSATSASSVGTVVTGVIDFEFEIGYVVTVTVGSKTLKGVLYHDPQNPALPKRPQHGSVPVNNESCSGESDSGNDKGIEHNMDDASSGMRGGVGAENLSKEKEGNDDGDQHAQKRMRA